MAFCSCANRASVVVPRWLIQAQGRRGYGVKPKYYKEVAQTYAKFRREVSELRKGFREEWLEEQRMTQTEFSAKAAEEARQREMEEVRALEAARRELERMAKKREISQKREEKRVQRKQERGEAVRREREETTAQMFARKVEQMENDMRDVMTLDNLDQKIEEALENEVLEDFVIAPDSGEQTTITFKSLAQHS